LPLTFSSKCSLLGLDGLYDPPRLMTSEATLDVPTPFSTTTTSAVPQQAVTVPQNVATPTADPADSPEQSASLSDAGTEGSALSEVASPLSDPAAAAETGTVGGGDGGSRSDGDVTTNPPNDPTAAMETQTPQLTTPGGEPAATDAADSSQLSDTSSSKAGESASAKSSSGGIQVFPADLFSLVFPCILLICLV
jgi:hypothetical protein